MRQLPSSSHCLPGRRDSREEALTGRHIGAVSGLRFDREATASLQLDDRPLILPWRPERRRTTGVAAPRSVRLSDSFRDGGVGLRGCGRQEPPQGRRGVAGRTAAVSSHPTPQPRSSSAATWLGPSRGSVIRGYAMRSAKSPRSSSPCHRPDPESRDADGAGRTVRPRPDIRQRRAP